MPAGKPVTAALPLEPLLTWQPLPTHVLEPNGTGLPPVSPGTACTFEKCRIGSANAVGVCNCAPKITSATTATMDKAISEVRMDLTSISPWRKRNSAARVPISGLTRYDYLRPTRRAFPLAVKLRCVKTWSLLFGRTTKGQAPNCTLGLWLGVFGRNGREPSRSSFKIKSVC